MNNIFLPSDPLLFNNNLDYQQMYELKLLRDRDILDKQYKDYLQSIQQRQTSTDYMTQLNSKLNGLTAEVKDKLKANSEFVDLNQTLLDTVLQELIKLVRDSINNNLSMVTNIQKQLKLIDEIDNESKETDRKNMAELNDYLKNYSNMTFDDYKKLKKTDKK